jgi:hypothetical protein
VAAVEDGAGLFLQPPILAAAKGITVGQRFDSLDPPPP